IDATDRFATLAAFAALMLLSVGVAFAQTPATLGAGSGQGTDAEWTTLSAVELEELIGPIALYPDDLIAIVLPASTFPLQIVQASRYLDEADADSELEPDAAWDESIVALLNYPEVIQLLNDDLDWTWALGEAVINQQADVLTAVQAFRDRAYAAGNLATDERQEVVAADDGTITIAPADPEVIYVPYYDPARVVVRSIVPVYHYYPFGYPVYYYPYPYGYSFGSRLFWGVTTAFAIGWSDYYLHVRHHSHYGHPYYGYNYYSPWYARTNIYVNVNRVGSYYRWRPGYRYGGYRHGGRPRHYARYDRLRDRRYGDAPRYTQDRADRLRHRRFADATRDTRVSADRLRDRQINRNTESRRNVIGTRDGRLQPNRVRDQRRTAESRPNRTNGRSPNRVRDGRLNPNRRLNQPRAGQTRATLRDRSIEDRRLRRNANRVTRSGADGTRVPRQARDTSNRGQQLANRNRDVAPRGNAARNNGARSASRDVRMDRRSTRTVPNRGVAQNRARTPSTPRRSLSANGNRLAGVLNRTPNTARSSTANGNRLAGVLGRSAAPQHAPAPRSNRGGYNREQPIRPPTARQVRPNRAPAANRGGNSRAQMRPQQRRVQPRAQQNRVRMQPQRAAPPNRGSGQRAGGGRGNRRAR
ncbi:MAG: DUF3300 domain-containing protein, partial [Gammaproteobacteria bacterium]|nr:DUF3300 domain-containing protein [Gammaproteobacteria bacterium]